VSQARKKKALDFKDYWGQQIFRQQDGQKEKLWALARRKYAEDDIERKGLGIYLGIKEEYIYEMETDNDPESETYGQRVPKQRTVYDTAGKAHEEPMPVETKFKLVDDVTPVNLKKYQALEGYNPIFGSTQLYWVISGRKIKCENPEDFWSHTLREVEKFVLPQKVSIVPTSK